MTLSFPSTLTIPKISFSGHRLEINSSVVDRANSIPSKIGVTFDIYSERDTLTTDKELNTYTNSVKFFFDGSLTKEQIKTILGNKLLQQTPQREKTSFDYLSSFVAESIFTDDQTDGKKIKVLGFCYPENNLSKDDLKAFFAVNLMALIQSAKDSKEKFSFIIPQPPGKLINSDLAIKTFFDALEETYQEYKPLIDKHIENFIVQLPESLLMDLKRYVKDTAFIKLADFSLYDLARKFAQNNIQTPLPINGNPSRLPGYNGYKAHETDFDSWLAKKCRNIHSLAYKNSAQKLQSLLSSSSTTTTKLRGGNFWFRSRISTSCIPSLATSSSPTTIRAEFAFESPISLTSPVSHDVGETQLMNPSVHLVPRLKYKRPPGRSRMLPFFSRRIINDSESPSPSPSTERNSSEFSLKNGKSSNEQAHFVFFVEQAVQGLDKLQDFRTNPDHAKNLLKIISFAKEKNGVSRKKDELQTFFQDDTNLTKQACTFSYNFQRLMIEYGNVEDENGKHPRSRLFRNIKLKNVEALFENLNLNNEENYKKLTSSLKESDPLKSRSRITSFFRQ